MDMVASLLKRPRTPPNNLAMDYQTADSGHVPKRSRALGTSDEVFYQHVYVLIILILTFSVSL